MLAHMMIVETKFALFVIILARHAEEEGIINVLVVYQVELYSTTFVYAISDYSI